jgi:carboxymethylenebutenolidase
MSDAMRAETIQIVGYDGDTVEAYLAQPLDGPPTGGVVVIHHMPGYDTGTKEITRRFAAQGYLAICPNLYYREAPGASPDDAAATARAQGGVPDERLVGDVGGAAAHLRSMSSSNGKVATIGYCSGGRQSFLAACSLDLDAAVDCYGAFIIAPPPDGFPLKVSPIANLAGNLSCPLLGLFGAEDQYPSPAEVDELEKVLTDVGKEFEFHSYEGAGHAFFATDRPSYRPEAANEGWQRIWEFFDRNLSNLSNG